MTVIAAEGTALLSRWIKRSTDDRFHRPGTAQLASASAISLAMADEHDPLVAEAITRRRPDLATGATLSCSSCASLQSTELACGPTTDTS